MIYDRLGSTEMVAAAGAVALAFNAPTATFARPVAELELAAPAPKGIGKGTGPWNPARQWQITASATIETGMAGPMVTEFDYWISQDTFQFRLT
jgi:hypothetical protein